MTRIDYIIWSASLISLLTIHGCVVAPDSIRPEVEHFSHATQHRPFTDSPTDYGADVASLVLHWDTPAHTYVEIGEGIALDSRDARSRSYGELIGPREEFQARAGCVITVPK